MNRGTIVVTLSEGALPGLVEAVGDVPVRWVPLLRFLEPEDWTPVDRAIAQLERYGGLALTSPRAAAAVGRRLETRRADRPEIATWLAGPGTAHAWRERLGPATVVEDAGAGAGRAVAEAILAAGVPGPILFPCGDARHDQLPDCLAAASLMVDEVVCYRSVLASAAEADSALTDALAVVVGSSRVARLVAARPRARATALVALGPTTAAAASEAGWPPAAVAGRANAEGVAAALRGVLTNPAASSHSISR